MALETERHVLIGLIGDNIAGSLSPALHEREGELQGLKYFYQRIDLKILGLNADTLPELLLAAGRLGFVGLNITHPCKQAVVSLLDELSDEARAIGSVNTVHFAEGKKVGHNTDGQAFVRSFHEELSSLPHETIVLLGAGGAGKAIAHSMLKSVDTSLVICDVNQQRAAGLVGQLKRGYGDNRARTAGGLAEALDGAHGVVNATPQGMKVHPESPVPAALLRSALWVADIVYFPIETNLLRAARAAGCRVMNGGGMAVYQAAEAFRLFTGIKPDVSRMREHFAGLIDCPDPSELHSAPAGAPNKTGS